MLKGEVFDKQTFKSDTFALFINTFLNSNNGIINNFGNSMQVSYSANNLTISSGVACIQGRFVTEDSLTTIDAGNNTLYCKLVIEIDLDKENTKLEFKQAYYKILTSETSYPELTQTDIVKNGTGIYQFELARFKTGLNGISDFVDKRKFLDYDSIYEEILAITLASHVKNGLMSATDKEKLDSIESEAQKNTVTGVKGSSEGNYRTGNINLTPANIGAVSKAGDSLTGDLTPDSNKSRRIGSSSKKFKEMHSENFFAELVMQSAEFVMNKAGAKIYDDVQGNVFILSGSSAKPVYFRNLGDPNAGYIELIASKFTQASAKRFKKNIRDITKEEANEILKINPIIFDFKNQEQGVNRPGVIAEDIDKIFPNLVTKTKTKRGKEQAESVDYVGFIPYLIKKIQMQDSEIESLKKELSKSNDL